MKDLKQFDEFIRMGIVKKQSPDKSRSKFLIMEAEQGYAYLLKLIKTMGVENQNANDYVKNCYDLLMELTRAKMLLEGLNASGFKAHEAEVAYWGLLQFKEQEIQDIEALIRLENIYFGALFAMCKLKKEHEQFEKRGLNIITLKNMLLSKSEESRLFAQEIILQDELV